MYDADEGYSIDEYWFSYFQDIDRALDKFTSALEQYRIEHPDPARTDDIAAIRDSTDRAETTLTEKKGVDPEAADELEEFPLARGSTTADEASPTRRGPSISPNRKQLSMSSSLSNRLRIFPLHSTAASATSGDGLASSTTTLTDKRASGTTTPREASTLSAPAELSSSATTAQDEDSHRYPPSIPPPDRSRSQGAWMPAAVGSTLGAVPNWLKHNLPGLPHSSGSVASARRKTSRKIVEVVSGGGSTLGSSARARAVSQDEGHPVADQKRPRTDLSKSVWDDEESAAGQEAQDNDDEADEGKRNEKFRKSFGLTDKESIVARKCFWSGLL